MITEIYVSELNRNISNFIQHTSRRCFQRNKTVDGKRAMSYEIVDTIQILGLQNFDDYGCLNPVEIIIDSNKIIETLSNYKKHKFRFI